MLNLTTRLCWNFLKKDGYIAVWQKPSDNSCYTNREAGSKPPLCDPTDDPDSVWYCALAFLYIDDCTFPSIEMIIAKSGL